MEMRVNELEESNNGSFCGSIGETILQKSAPRKSAAVRETLINRIVRAHQRDPHPKRFYNVYTDGFAQICLHSIGHRCYLDFFPPSFFFPIFNYIKRNRKQQRDSRERNRNVMIYGQRLKRFVRTISPLRVTDSRQRFSISRLLLRPVIDLFRFA